MMPLTGVPLPFISYGASNLVVLMGAMGLLLNVAATGGQARRAGRPADERPELRALDGGGDANDRDRRRRHGGTRRAGARGS
jgi:cell division protein FtsW